MSNLTCKNLQAKLQSIKRLKLQFDLSLRSATNLKNIPELQKQLDLFKTEIYDLKLKLVENLEAVKILEKQYYDQIEILEKLEICSKEEPFLIDINGVRHQLASFNDIKVSLTLEILQKINTLKEPTLLLTPFGLNLHTLAKKIKKNQKNLIKKTRFNSNFELDKVECIENRKEISYFPENTDFKNHNGKTKSKVIEEQGGWLISIVEGETNLSPFTTNDDLCLNDVRIATFEKLKKSGNKGLIPEEYLMLSLVKLKKGKLMDSRTGTILNGVANITDPNAPDENIIFTGGRLFCFMKKGLLYVSTDSINECSDYANSRTSIHLKVKK